MIRQLVLVLILVFILAGVGWAGQHEGGSPPDDETISEQERETDERMGIWEERMQEIGRQADDLSREGRERLERAWEDTQEQRDKLSEASRQQWEKARGRLADAMDRLERAWEAATEEQPPEQEPD
ncbi:hypothetical protein [Aquisalimonas sp.]|uniref:hypothetical protein n=1 Tax=Aquisalimonas sp. TaxID=1872621 RepID=UPI0025B98E60|nr:hypothetical protein [Aquisalimonas sp.]